MNERHKNELENLKAEAREFKNSLLHVLAVLFILFVAGITIWQIWELFNIFFIENIGETLQSILGLIFWAVVAVIAFFAKSWWDERQNRKMWDGISRDLRENPPKQKEHQELQVHFFRKTPKYPKKEENKNNE